MSFRPPGVGIVLVVVAVAVFATRSLWEPRFLGTPSEKADRHARDLAEGSGGHYTAEDYKKAAARCMSATDYACAQKNWLHFLELRPNDGTAYASLGIARNQLDDHKGAVEAFERAIDLGEGAYDMFAYYADSLAKVGRTDDAVNWYYKTLTVVPTLVDVRGSLAKLLVLQKRHYEALSLLESFDTQLQMKSQPPYFEGQRIAIETALSRNEAPRAVQTGLRLPKFEDHFYVPVYIGDARPEAFVVDTGASHTAMDEALLVRSRAHYQSSAEGTVLLKTADGRTVAAKAIVLDSLKVGPYLLKAVPALVCRGCVSLLGQSALSKFDLKSSKVNSVEFLTLALRQ
jgi:clan AA aspartic protease (TIGR02281 family)